MNSHDLQHKTKLFNLARASMIYLNIFHFLQYQQSPPHSLSRHSPSVFHIVIRGGVKWVAVSFGGKMY